jgi:hypothetical protein
MSTLKEKTLLDALSFVSLRTLPTKAEEDDNYLSAIVEVVKVDGTTSYALQKTRDDLTKYIAKDFGTISTIKEIVSIHPFEFLKEKYVFNGTTKEEKIQYLKKMYKDEDYDFDTMPLKEINKMIKMIAVKYQTELDN